MFRISSLLLFSFYLAGCQITQDMDYSSLETNSASCTFPVSKLTISAPTKGENVFKFEDIVTANVASGASFISMNNVKRADFNYVLVSDSEPDIRKQIQDIFPENGSESLSAHFKFNYYITEATSMKNSVRLLLTATLIEGGESSSYITAKVDDSYSTFPVTYPSKEFLTKMLSSALEEFKKDLCTANGLQRAPKHTALGIKG